MTEAPWTAARIPDLRGRRALVTGPTSGVGKVTARELARAGAEVVLAARNPEKLAATSEELRAALPGAALVPLRLDLADLSSVRRAAATALALGPLHLLVNNAGVMAPPHERTWDGFELQLGTNHLGHFALTGLLMPQLVAGRGRVVTVSSVMARTVRTLSLTDPRLEQGRYRRWNAYGQSKLANLLFTVELDRRVRAHDLPVTAVAAHPGWTRTNLVDNGMNKERRTLDGTISLAVTSVVAQGVDDGALPLLRAAVDHDLRGAAYVGPSGAFELHGHPRVVPMPRPAQDPELASGLWTLSESATGVSFP